MYGLPSVSSTFRLSFKGSTDPRCSSSRVSREFYLPFNDVAVARRAKGVCDEGWRNGLLAIRVLQGAEKDNNIETLIDELYQDLPRGVYT